MPDLLDVPATNQKTSVGTRVRWQRRPESDGPREWRRDREASDLRERRHVRAPTE